MPFIENVNTSNQNIVAYKITSNPRSLTRENYINISFFQRDRCRSGKIRGDREITPYYEC